jgi:nicotinamide mononucleotide transporter
MSHINYKGVLGEMSSLLHQLVVPFNATAFTLFGEPTTWGEVLGFVTGVWCVWLVVRRNIWNWPVGIANNVFFLLLFVEAGLFADSALQVVYLVLGFYGWWAWVRGGAHRTELPMSRTTRTQWIWLLVIGVVATFALGWLLANKTTSTVPAADSLTTVLSLLATWGQARKKVESWWLWIAADVIYVPLYQYKGLTLTALLYLGFLALCVAGLRAWTQELKRHPTGTVPAPVLSRERAG